MIEIVEPDDGSQKPREGKFWVYCDCNFGTVCPQGKPCTGTRCCVPIAADRLSEKEQKRLMSPQR